jgi:hypothetical protein
MVAAHRFAVLLPHAQRNETVSVVVMRIYNKDRSPLRIHG